MDLNSLWEYVKSEKYALLVAMLIGFICPIIYDFIKKWSRHFKRSDFDGVYETEIYIGSDVEKRDEIRVIHDGRNDTLFGVVNRRYPVHFNNRRWRMQGIYKTNKIVCIVWPDQLSESMCCASFFQVGKNHFSGSYYRYDDSQKCDISFRIELRKIRELTPLERLKLTFFRGR